MDLDYDQRRQEFEAGVHRPSDIHVAEVGGAVTVWLSVLTYPKLREIFEPLAKDGEGVTFGDYSWRGLAPSPEHFSEERPIMLRLDLSFKIPATYRLPILFPIESTDDISHLAAIAESGLIVLKPLDAPVELEDTELPLAVPWPELQGLLADLISTGVIQW